MSAMAIAQPIETWPHIPERDGYEYADGRWEKLNVAAGPIQIAARLVLRLLSHATPLGLGWALFGETPFQIWPEQPRKYRKPDGSFIRAAALADGVVPAGFVHAIPAIVIEVISPGDRFQELDRKVQEYLDAGVELVWVLAPDSKTVTVHRPDGHDTRLKPGDVLTGEEVLPGFAVPVDDLFDLRLG